MVKIFISYRRADSQYVTDIVYEHMARHFGKDNVFLDVGSIPFGVDFRAYLNQQIAEHDVVLVIIGPDWARIMRERAGQQNDFVRIEIESALQQGKLVVPVLVKNASMPDFSDLPESIRELQWRNSAIVRRQPDLENDCTRLADGIRQYAKSVGIGVQPALPSSADLLPQPFAWIEIPDGRGTMQASGDVTLQIPTERYWMAKYPVTNAQFAKFIAADGYSTERWWTEAGWQRRQNEGWTEPRYWGDSQWNGAEQPVVGVSWYEAVAFCLWLSETTGENIMLPTEAQWQYAAQGTDGRAYPWGNQWDCKRCNNSVKPCSSDRTTPVTQYAGKNDSPSGVVDMAGNVWQWCLTTYESRTDRLSGTDSRVLRGGSWFNSDVDFLRCDGRSGGSPHSRDVDVGFRVVRS